MCCRTLKGTDERSLVNPDIVKDVIIGLSDGLTVPFALTAGLSSLGSSHLVVVAGIAELGKLVPRRTISTESRRRQADFSVP